MAERASALPVLVRAFASEHHWVLGRQELLDLGMPVPTLESWLASGRLVALLKSTYGYGRDIESP